MKSIVFGAVFAFISVAWATPVVGTGDYGALSGWMPELSVELTSGAAWLPEPSSGRNPSTLDGLIRGFAPAQTADSSATGPEQGLSPLRLGTEVGALLLARSFSLNVSGAIEEEGLHGFSLPAMAVAGVFVLGLLLFRRKAALSLMVLGLLGAAAGPAAAEREKTQNDKSPSDSASITLGGKKITIDYNAPSARGRQVEGGLIPYGRVWRTGADAATTLNTAADLMVGGLRLGKGEYTLYTLASENGWKLIVNKQTGQWGTSYDDSQDLGRLDMKVAKRSAPAERFRISLQPNGPSDATLQLSWGMTDASVPLSLAR